MFVNCYCITVKDCKNVICFNKVLLLLLLLL